MDTIKTQTPSKVLVRYFDNWKNDGDTVLFSADSKSIKEFQKLMTLLASRQIERVNLSSFDYIQPVFNTNIYVVVCEKDIGMIKSGDIFEWSVSPLKWKHYSDLLSVFQDNKKGHQYLDVEHSFNSMSVQVSVNEYSLDWIGWEKE